MDEEKLHIIQKIDAYVKNALSEEEIQALWTAFAKDPSLLEDLELEVGVKKLIEAQALKQLPSPGKIRPLPRWTWHAVAAAVIILVAGIQFFNVGSRTKISQFVAPSISPDQIETADGIRAKDMKLAVADSLLNLGFNAYISGNYNQALALFNEVIDKHDIEPYGSKAYVNKGILLYNTSEYDSAVVAFQRALERVKDSRMIEEKAYWYLGNALVNVGKLEEARNAVQHAWSLDGIFRKPAFLLLQKLNYDLGHVDYDNFEKQQSN